MVFEYIESTDEAAQAARAALPLANKFGLPANPINYALLYAYVTRKNPDLCAALEEAFSSNMAPTSTAFRELYKKYMVDAEQQLVDSLRQAILEMLESTGSALLRIDGESKLYNEHLDACLEDLDGVESKSRLGEMVHSLKSQTEMMLGSASTMRNELEQTRQELAELRDEFQRVRQESLIDPLTGINNRRVFDRRIEEIAEQSRQADTNCCLLLIDIDHFKKINDHHGHIIGDAVLKWFARILRETVRGSDLVARYGGEEFAVLLPETDLIGARTVAENIRRRVGEQNLRLGQKQIGKVTCSTGVALINGSADIIEWLAHADGAMYRAKQTGRDRVCVFDPKLA